MWIRYVSVLTALALSVGSVFTPANSDTITPQVLAQISENSSASEPPEIIQKLNITPGQILQLDIIRRQLIAPTHPLYEQWKNAQMELDALLVSPDASESQIRDKYRQVQLLRQNISDLEFETRMATREVLRPEQRVPFEQYFQSIMQANENRTENPTKFPR